MSRFTTFGLTILLAFAPAALAVDGTVLINQGTITNGLPGCPTGGHFPIVICQSGSYKLSGNVTVPDANTTAIQITVDNVTLDLNGFSILGPVVCSDGGIGPVKSCSPNGSGVGISGGNSYIAISNGMVRGFGNNGIAVSGQGARIERVTVSNNGNFGINLEADDALVTLCHADFNGTGIFGGGTISNSSARLNRGQGVIWSGTVSGNIALGNGGTGFTALGVLTSNNAIGNGGAGIEAADVSVIISNYVSVNAAGINAASGSVVLNNVVQ